MSEWYAKLDELWDDFWPATELRPLAVVDFINDVFLARQLDEKDGRLESLPANPLAQPVFSVAQEDLRWSSFQHLDEHRLYLLFNKKDGVLDSVKSSDAYSKLRKFDDQADDLKPIPPLLAKTVRMVNALEVADNSTRSLMNEYLLTKAEAASKTRELELSNSSFNRNTKAPERPKRSSNVYVLLLILFLTAFGATFFYFQYKKPNAASLNQQALQDSSTQTDSSLVLASEKNRDKKNASANKKSSKRNKKANNANLPNTNTNDQYKTVNTKQKDLENKTSSKADTKGLYKIISKAYFHNEPDEATRRNAFVLHWNNSYAKLKALDEKNGFIYVVFHNHLNQTSKGWLRKKDLEPIDQ